MDLFADLPPPAPTSKECQGDNGLFGDLPDPQNESSSNLVSKGEKRSLDSDSDERSLKHQNKQPSSARFLLKGFVAERKGERDDMQDAHVILDDFQPEFNQVDLPTDVSRLSYYAIFDGHAGGEASKFAADNLHKNIVAKFPKGEVLNKDREIRKCLVEAYRKTDEEFLQEAAKHNPPLKDGSTAVSILVVNDILYIANLGDSKALLCRRTENGKYTVVNLTKDHSPTQYDERLRIQKSGGNVRDGRVLGILEVSRSFGDGRFKGCGVIATPDLMRCSLTDKDKFLLLACDGLWKGFDVDEALTFINNILQEKSMDNGKEQDEENQSTSVYETACSRVASDAIRKGSSDNVTVMMVEINSQSKTDLE